MPTFSSSARRATLAGLIAFHILIIIAKTYQRRYQLNQFIILFSQLPKIINISNIL